MRLWPSNPYENYLANEEERTKLIEAFVDVVTGYNYGFDLSYKKIVSVLISSLIELFGDEKKDVIISFKQGIIDGKIVRLNVSASTTLLKNQ